MNRNLLDNRLSRRGFMRQAACAGVGAATMINALSSLRLTAAATALNSEINDQSDNKTIVCIYLAGGNDSHNLLVPFKSSGNSQIAYGNYIDARQNLSLISQPEPNELPDVSPVSLNPLTVNDSTAFKFYQNAIQPLATHHNTKEISQLFNANELAFVCNVGTLVAPLGSRAEMTSIGIPEDLYSHNSQTMQWMTSIADGPSSTGWGGRVADILHAADTANQSSPVSMAVSLTGFSTTFLRSSGDHDYTPVGITAAGAPTFMHNADLIGNPANRRAAVHDVVDNLLRLSDEHLMPHEHLLTNEYMTKARSGGQLPAKVNDALHHVPQSDRDEIGRAFKYDNTETDIDFDLAKQLKMVAQLIAANGQPDSSSDRPNTLNNKRQIFFVSVGGYDTHDNHLEAHGELMTELSVSLGAFKKALENTGTDSVPDESNWDRTVAFTMSDFNRTLGPNVDGVDHAWAGHQIVMGGPVAGGKIYGDFPSLATGGNMDATTDGRGRFIPTVSVDQYAAEIVKWFGDNPSEINTIFPTLYRFGTHTNLNFLS